MSRPLPFQCPIPHCPVPGEHLGRNHRRHLRQGRRRQDHHQRQLAVGLARRGKKIAVIDFDVGLRNLDLIMGCERRVVYDFVNVIHGEGTLKQALIKDKRFDNLFVLAASQTRDKDALTQGRRREGAQGPRRRRLRLHRLRLAGRHREGRVPGDVLRRPRGRRRESGSVLGARLRPHPRPARRARRGAPSTANEPIKEHLLLTRYNPERVAERRDAVVDDVKEILGLEVIGVIPESPRRAAGVERRRAGDPRRRIARPARPTTTRSRAFLGEDTADALHRRVEKKGFFSKLFGG